MKTNNQLNFSSVVLGVVVGAVAALFLAPAPSEARGNMFVSDATRNLIYE